MKPALVFAICGAIFAAPAALGAPSPKLGILAKGLKVTEITLAKSVPLSEATAFDLDSRGVPFLLAGGKLINTWDGAPVLPSGALSAFAFLPSGGVLTVSHDKLGTIDNAAIVERIALPSPAMKIAARNDHSAVLYGGKDDATGNAIYLYQDNGTYRKLVEAPGAIGALAVIDQRMLFSVKSAVFDFSPGSPPKPVLMLPGEQIRSLAFAPSAGYFYVSTDRGIFLGGLKRLIPLVTGVDCTLRTGKDAVVYALCPAQAKLLRMAVAIEEITKVLGNSGDSMDAGWK